MSLKMVRHATRLSKALSVAAYQSLYSWAIAHHAVDRRANFNKAIMQGTIHSHDGMFYRKELSRGYPDEQLYQDFVSNILQNTMVTYDGLVSLASQARFCEEHDIPGAFVELGTWKGGCVGIMAQANLKFGKARRTIHAFDSYQGLPAPRADKDYEESLADAFKVTREQSDGSLQPINALVASQSDVENLLKHIGYPLDLVKFHVGWFQNTVPQAATEIGSIAILRLDGDLYDSYMVALDHLWDHVVNGGFVIIDDWVFKGCREAVTEFFAKRNVRSYLNNADATVKYIQKY